jgi:hypothetical protein
MAFAWTAGGRNSSTAYILQISGPQGNVPESVLADPPRDAFRAAILNLSVIRRFSKNYAVAEFCALERTWYLVTFYTNEYWNCCPA